MSLAGGGVDDEGRTRFGSVRFCCTAGGGMEVFLLEEVKRKLNATEVN